MSWSMNDSYQEEEEEVVVGSSACNRTQLLIFLPLVQTVFSLLYVFIGVCGFLGNGLIVLAAVRYIQGEVSISVPRFYSIHNDSASPQRFFHSERCRIRTVHNQKIHIALERN